MASQVAAYVTERIIAQLQAGVVPWRRPWVSDPAINYVSRKAYQGINTLLLPEGGEYLTFKQVTDLGGTVKKGSTSHMVVYYKVLPAREATADQEERRSLPLLRYYRVFALADTEGIPSKLVTTTHQPVAEAEAIVTGYASGPTILQSHQDRAYYSPAWERAKAERLIPYRETLTTWTVKHYTVTVTGAGWSDLACSCPAGRSHKTCKHMAVVAKAISAHVLPVKGTAKRHEAIASAAPVWRMPSPYRTNEPVPDVGNRPVPPLPDGPLT